MISANLRTSLPPSWKLGTAEVWRAIEANDRLAEIVAQNFNSLAPQVEHKISHVRRIPDNWNFSGADKMADFARSADMELRGHIQLSYWGVPEWLRDLSDSEVEAEVRQFIQETIARYPQIGDWDICGEFFCDDGTERENFWRDRLGRDYISKFFEWARTSNPGARLFYSENRLQYRAKQVSVLAAIDKANSRSQLIDGLSIQLHHNVLGCLKIVGLMNLIQEIRARDLKTRFSEITLWRNGERSPVLGEIGQAIAAVEIARLAQKRSIFDLTFWGASDRQAWARADCKPCLFDREGRPKLAFEWLRKFLRKSKG